MFARMRQPYLWIRHLIRIESFKNHLYMSWPILNELIVIGSGHLGASLNQGLSLGLGLGLGLNLAKADLLRANNKPKKFYLKNLKFFT